MLEWPSLDELRRRRSYKWRLHGQDVLPAFVAEMDVLLAPSVRDAITEAAAIGDTGYTFGVSELQEAASAFFSPRHAWSVDPADVAVVPDVMGGVLEVLRRITEPGDGVVITPPVYAPFFEHIEEADCRVVEAPLARSGTRYELDMEALDGALRDARVLLLCHPQNPTGRAWTHDELQRVVAVAARHDAMVLSDEVHAPLTLWGAQHVPLSTVDGAAERTLVFTAASKAWNIPGLKCAQMVAQSEPMRAVLRSLGERLTFRTGHVGVLASTAAYSDGGEWLDEMVRHIERMHRLYADLMADTPVVCTPADATYVAWLDCAALGWGDDPASRFLERGRVALDSGLKYGASGAGFARVTLATSEPLVREIAARMDAALTT